jgi:hypothetical protein
VPYDQQLKELLRIFFPGFMASFFPEEASRLDLSQVTFLEKETATDVGGGLRREMDLVARVLTRDGDPELILVLVELQARPEPDFSWRLFEYYTLLRRLYRLAVLPMVVYVRGGRGVERWEEYREALFGETIILFRYRRLRLRALEAEAAVHSGEPLSCALAPLMNRRGVDLAVLKAESLRGIGQSRLDEARRWLLANFVETYLPLSGPAEQQYRQMLAQEEFQMARQLDYETWREQQRQEGLQQGRQEGRQEGHQEGLLEGKKDVLLAVLRARFGSVAGDLERQIRSIDTVEELDALVVSAVRAASQEEVRAALHHGAS